MSDYIKREDAIRQIVKTSAQNELDIPAIGTVIYILSEMDSADVRENVRGEWINTTSGEHYKCSQCGTLAPIWIDESNSCEYDKDISEWLSDFCPNCGADMRRDKA